MRGVPPVVVSRPPVTPVPVVVPAPVVPAPAVPVVVPVPGGEPLLGGETVPGGVLVPVVVPLPVVPPVPPVGERAVDATVLSQSRCRAGLEPPVSEFGSSVVVESPRLPEPDGGVAVDCPGVGAAVGPLPSGTRSVVMPVPGVPECDGNVNDCPGVGAGVGPVPLGIELPGVERPGAVPVVDPVPEPPAAPPPAAPPPVPPLAPPPAPPPAPPLCASADSALHVTNAAVTSVDNDLDDMRASPMGPPGDNVASLATFRARRRLERHVSAGLRSPHRPASAR
jgi:hypothetical protein